MRVSLLLAVFLAAAVARAQAPGTFREGVIAFEKQEWASAEVLMRKTIAVNPTESEGTVSISGQWFETYVPHYFLARALARQGKCAAALAAFAESERQGVTPGIEDFARHLKTRDGCKGRREITIDVPLEGGTSTRSKDPVEAPSVKPPSVKPKDPVVPPGTPALASQQPRQPPPAKRPDPETRARLVAGATAYLNGHYEETLRILGGAVFAASAASAEAALLRAAAGHALYRAGGEKDPSLRDQITRELLRYRALRPSGDPDPRLFPPAFRALLQ